MHIPKSELSHEMIEERLLQVLSQNKVLPYSDLKTHVAAGTDDRAFRWILNELIARGSVRRKADRKGLWYHGYAIAQPGDYVASLDEIPAPFRKLLSELACL